MENTNFASALKDDYLAAYQSILFSRSSDNDMDLERQLLAVKFMTARKLESEETAALLLCQGLKQYEKLLVKSELFEKIKPGKNEDRRKWRSSLKDPKQALSLMNPLPCQKNSFDKICSRRDLVDRDIENLMKIGEETDDCSTIRKVSIAQPPRITDTLTLRCKQENFHHPRYNRFDDSQPEPLRKDSERTETTSSKECQQKLRFFRSENDQPSRIPSKNRWENLDCSGNKYEHRSGTGRLENETSAGTRKRNQWERIEDDENPGEPERAPISGAFRTAKAELHIQQQQQQKSGKKSLGGKASVNSRFVCPLKRDKEREVERNDENSTKDKAEPEDERLKGIDEKFIELVRNEIMDSGKLVSWDDVAGLEHAKKIIKEIVVLPMLRPDIFTGLRRPPKGILLFGPPGTGKTLIGKCIASQSKSTFFSISASSLTSKWIGEGEKMVRALFAVARVHQPSVIFIDEIDSLLTQRSETEHESSRRIKTEFLVQLDGAATGEEDRILVIGATNRPQELDEAARRRFVKRLYIPLPEFAARRQIVVNLLAAIPHELNGHDIDKVAEASEHYSGADMTNLCKEASMGPIRSIPFEMLENIKKEDVRCVTPDDFHEALTYVRPSVSHSDLGLYVNWDRTYGSGTASL